MTDMCLYYECSLRNINCYCQVTGCRNPLYNGSGTYIIKSKQKYERAVVKEFISENIIQSFDR